MPLLVNTVDLERGAPVIWGSPGLQDVYVQDAVYASCALPGLFPARARERSPLRGRWRDRQSSRGDRGAQRGSDHRGRRRQHRPSSDHRRDVARLREHLHARGDDDDARAPAVSAHALGWTADGADPSALRRGLAELQRTSPTRFAKDIAPRTKRSRTSRHSTISRAASIRDAGSSSSVDRDEVHRLRAVRVARAEPHGHGQRTAKRIRGRDTADWSPADGDFVAPLPDGSDRRAEDRADRAAQGGRTGRCVALSRAGASRGISSLSYAGPLQLGSTTPAVHLEYVGTDPADPSQT